MRSTTQNVLRARIALLYVAEALIWLHLTWLGQQLVHWVATETEQD